MTAWTDERVGLLKTLWAEGMSASDIGDAISATSRNSVIGKARRLGLESRNNKGSGDRTATAYATGNYRPAKKPRKPPKPGPIALNAHVGYASLKTGNPIVPSLPPERVEDKDIPVAQRCTIMGLTLDTCRWPIGTPGESGFAFCGGEISKRPWGPKTNPVSCPYCDAHADRAVRKAA